MIGPDPGGRFLVRPNGAAACVQGVSPEGMTGIGTASGLARLSPLATPLGITGIYGAAAPSGLLASSLAASY